MRINTVSPGTIDTPTVTHIVDSGDLDLDATLAALPMGRLDTADEVASAVLWLCSSRQLRHQDRACGRRRLHRPVGAAALAVPSSRSSSPV